MNAKAEINKGPVSGNIVYSIGMNWISYTGIGIT